MYSTPTAVSRAGLPCVSETIPRDQSSPSEAETIALLRRIGLPEYQPTRDAQPVRLAGVL